MSSPAAAASGHRPAPGTEPPGRRFRPRPRWELVGCGISGHELVGTDAAAITDDDALLVREDLEAGLRWFRCLRCDSWLPLPPPANPVVDHVPGRDQITLPLRGRPLRDRYVLRVIAADRVLHFLALAAVAVAILLFARDRANLHGDYTQILDDLQASFGGPISDSRSHGLLKDVDSLFALSSTRLYVYGVGIAAYAAINGIEAYGLWRARRWAEYLTLFEVAVLLPIEIYELTERISTFKIITLVLNLLVVAYLIGAHRLLGVRGGGRAQRAERERDSGWPALEAATPTLATLPRHPAAS